MPDQQEERPVYFRGCPTPIVGSACRFGFGLGGTMESKNDLAILQQERDRLDRHFVDMRPDP